MWWALIPMVSALTLEEAWDLAERDGEESVMLTEQRRQADLMRAQAWATLAPRVVAGANWTRNQREVALDFGAMLPEDMVLLIEGFTGEPFDAGDPTVIQQLSYFDANLSIIQPILNARSVPGLRGAYAMVDAGAAAERAGRADLRVGVARAWWGVLVAREAETLSTDAKKLAEEHAKVAKALVEAGSATPQANLQAQMAVARAERELVSATARREQAELSLSALIGQPVEGTITRGGPREVPWSDLEAAMDSAAVSRPELAAAEAQARVAQAIHTASVLGWAPTVDARFTQAWSENTGFSGENFNWMFVVSANWTLWDGGYRIVDNAKTQSQLYQADAARRQAEETARIEVSGAWRERERAMTARSAAERELALAEENLRMAEASYAAGASAFMDLEDARVARDGAKVVVLTETMNVELATLNLLAAVGTLR